MTDRTLGDINREAYSKFLSENHKGGYDAWQASAQAVADEVHRSAIEGSRVITEKRRWAEKEENVVEAARVLEHDPGIDAILRLRQRVRDLERAEKRE